MQVFLSDQEQALRRRHKRYPLRGYGSLLFEDQMLTVRLIDLSLGGVALRMPLPVISYGRFGTLRFRLPDVCNLRADLRWKSHHSIGLEFDPMAARQCGALITLLQRLEAGNQADSREITTVTSGFFPISP